jgi:hypothetical protein
LAASTITSTRSDLAALGTGFCAYITLLNIERNKTEDKRDFIDMMERLLFSKAKIKEKMPGIHE